MILPRHLRLTYHLHVSCIQTTVRQSYTTDPCRPSLYHPIFSCHSRAERTTWSRTHNVKVLADTRWEFPKPCLGWRGVFKANMDQRSVCLWHHPMSSHKQKLLRAKLYYHVTSTGVNTKVEFSKETAPWEAVGQGLQGKGERSVQHAVKRKEETSWCSSNTPLPIPCVPSSDSDWFLAAGLAPSEHKVASWAFLEHPLSHKLKEVTCFRFCAQFLCSSLA